jgi:hypothetical protein
MLYIVDQDCDSAQKLFFCYHLPTRGRVGVKLGDAWYVSNVSIIFDAPCVFIHHFLCILLYFVGFLCIFGTNLLTRCHSASSLFSAVFVFQKIYTENILGIGQNKSQTFYFYRSSRRPKMRRRGSRGRPHPRVARPRPGPRHQGVSRPGPPSDAALSPISPLNGKNLRNGSLFHETYCKLPPSPSRDRENLGALPDTLPEAFSTTMVASGVMCE